MPVRRLVPDPRHRPRSPLRRWLGPVWAVVVGVALTLTPVLPARADTAATPFASTITVTGAGWGHGWGMSQYGAYGAATQGRTWRQILAFYYPGTTIGSLAGGSTIRVWVTADTDGTLTVLPASGLRLTDPATGASWAMPTGSGYTQWRVSRSGAGSVLHYRTPQGAWVTRTPGLSATARWQVETSSGVVRVVLPGSRTRELRGQVSLTPYGSGARTVNRLPMDSYLNGVVPAEMPTSWAAEAVRAQAVAARSYAARLRAAASTSAGYDVCDTTACQVYTGLAETVGGRRTVFETSGGNAAVAATAGQVVMSGGSVALTQFSSSNGGHTARGDYPYLVARTDPYDGVVRNQSWSVTLSSARVAAAYPSIGTLRSVQVTSRDGAGRWGGRVRVVTVVGSRGQVSVSGAAFRSTFGLRSSLFVVTGGLATSGVSYRRWQAEGGVTGWMGAPTATERSVAGGQEARFDAGDVMWSSATGTRVVRGGIRNAYRRLGGPTSMLGFPTTEETGGPAAGSYQMLFPRGGIYWSWTTSGHEVHGAIYTYYRSLGGATSRLGLPTTDERNGAVAGSRKSGFQRGAVYWSPATGAREVSGAAYSKYRSVGEEASRLGLPTRSLAATSAGTSVDFQHGRIACTTAGACTISYR